MKKVNVRIYRITIMTLLALLVAVFSLAIETEQSNAQTQLREIYYGMFEDAGKQVGDDDWEATILDLQSRGMNAIAFSNNTPNLNISDRLGFNVVGAIHYQINSQWFEPSPVPATWENAYNIIAPEIERLKRHPSLIGINLADDARPEWNQRIRMGVEVARQVAPNIPTVPVLIRGHLGQEVYDASRPDAALLYYYPARNGTQECDFYGYTDVDWADTIRLTMQDLEPGTPLWLILQAHSTTEGPNDPDGARLRVPTIPELRLQNWLAIGEGAEGIFWFLYSTVIGQPWVGIKDSPEMYAEITDLARRVNVMRPVLENSDKSADRFHIASNHKAYTATFYNPITEKYYALFVNQTCTAQTVTVDSWYFNGQLRDVESGQTINLGSGLTLRGGDGRLFELVGGPKVLPHVPQPNLVSNPGFERVQEGQIADWAVYGNIARDTTVRRSGQASLRVMAGDRHALLQNLTLEPNTRYYLSYWVRGQNMNNSVAGMSYVRVNEPARQLVNTNWEHSGTYNWKKRVAYFTTPADLTTGRLDINWGDFGANTVAWYDDITLCKTTEPCADNYLDEVSPPIFETMAAPAAMSIGGNTSIRPVRPTFTWKHDLDGQVTQAPGQFYQVVAQRDGEGVLNTWVNAETICNGVTCTFTPGADLLPDGLRAGEYNWWVRGWRSPIYSQWSDTSSFSTTAELPTYDGQLSVDVSTGRVIVNMAADERVEWIQVWIGTTDLTKVYQKWVQLTPEVCKDGQCSLVLKTHPQNGDYVLYFRTWGNQTFTTGSPKVWYKPVEFSLNAPAPIASTGLASTDHNGKLQLTWNASPGTTWYNLWVGTPAPAYDGRHFKWYSAIDLGCAGGGTCTLTTDLNSNGGPYAWFVREWGPGGFDRSRWTEGTVFDPSARPDAQAARTLVPKTVAARMANQPVEPQDAPADTSRASTLPAPAINYSLHVSDWWGTHPYNPATTAANHIAVGGVQSPSPQINVCDYKAGSNTAGIQQALAQLPASGGTLYFPSDCGPYVMSRPWNWVHNQYHSGFDWIGPGANISVLRRNNVHFVSDEAGATIVGTWQITSMSYRDNYTKINPVSGYYFKNLTFETNHPYGVAMYFEDVNDILFDNVTFKNSGFLSVINGDNIWIRDSRVINGPGFYFDGSHASGIIGTTFSGNVGVNNLYKDAAMIDFHVNNDATRDMNENGVLDPHELRQPRYFAFVDNIVFGANKNHNVLLGGVRDVIAVGNHIYGPMKHFVNVVGDIRRIPGINDWYDYLNYVVNDNTIHGLYSVLRLSPPEGSYSIGKYEVSNNTVTYIEEVVTAWGSGYVSPQTAGNNCLNGSIDNGSVACNAVPPIPRALSVSGPLEGQKVEPTLTWQHQMSGISGVPANTYRVYIRHVNDGLVLDQNYPANSLCSGNTCSLTVDLTSMTRSGVHEWWIGGRIDGVNVWMWSGGPEYNAASFTLDINPTPLPQNISVDIVDFYPVVSWDDDAQITWVRVWMGPGSFNNYLKWHGRDQDGGFTCNAGRCSVAIPWDTSTGDYKIWLRSYGPNGVSRGGEYDGWIKGPDFTISAAQAGLPSNLGIADAGSATPMLTWQNTGNATWFDVMVVGPNQNYRLRWHRASALGCTSSGQICQLDAAGIPNGEYTLYVRAWGPGGFSADSSDNDQWAQGAFTYTGQP